MSQDIENQQITSLKYTAITSRLRQNEGFWHVGRLKQCKRVASVFHCSRFVVHYDVGRYNWAGNTTDALWPSRRKATTPRQDR